MKTSAKIKTEKINGNLHISIHGPYTPETAAQLVLLIEKTVFQTGIILIHTDNITRIAKKAQRTFVKLADILKLSQDNIYFQGKRGALLCYDISQTNIHVATDNHQKSFGNTLLATTQEEEYSNEQLEFLWKNQTRQMRFKYLMVG